MSTASPTVRATSFDQSRVLVAGDVMLDRYWHGGTSRISPEAPVPVVHVQDIEERLGGAANVAVNVAALGARPVLIGNVGDDEAADIIEQLLGGYGIESRLEHIAGCSTVTKMRVMSRHQQLIRLDFEDGFRGRGIALRLDAFRDAVSQAGAVVLSDYGKGALDDPQQLIQCAHASGCPTLVDPKGTDFSRYRGATVITPNLAEFEAVVGACHDLDELAARGERLCTELGLEALLVTRSEHGMSLLRPAHEPVHVPARARDVYDVTGAGDTVIGMLATALAANKGLIEGMELANLAASIVVAKLGTASVSVEELRATLSPTLSRESGVLSEAALMRKLAEARQKEERVVMTNGCFDILHAGHVSYLTQAKSLGDHLLVAVNDDASVQRLKGHGRPINTVDKRMSVLAALEAVDWVVSFSEDTPERLISTVLPNVLVKGGDYQPHEVVGRESVIDNGGRVEILGYQDGCSTSEIITAICDGPTHVNSGTGGS